MNDATKEAAKELARMLIFGLIGLGIAYFSGLPQTQTTGIVLLVLRAADKFIHENKDISATGLTPF